MMKRTLKLKYLILLFLAVLAGGQANAQSLEEYLQMASKNNPRLQAAYTEFEAAMQKAPQVAGLPDPVLTMSAFGRMIETRGGTQEARFSLMQMFPWFGTLKAREDAATLVAEVKFERYLDLRNRLFLDLRSAYAELYATQETIRLKEENLSILDSYRQLALSRFKSGDAPMVNVIKTDIEIESAVTEISLLKALVKPLEADFNLLLNREPGIPVTIKDTLKLLKQKKLVDTISLFRDHPEIAALQKEERSFEMQREIAKKEGMPNLGLGVDYSIISSRPEAGFEENGRDAIMPVLSISLPVFRKKYRAAEKEAALMAKSLNYSKEARKNEFFSQFEMAAYEVERAHQLTDLYNRQIESSLQANKLLVSGFRNATVDFQEVLQMNQQILLLRTQKVEALKKGFTAQAKLEYLLSKNQ